MEEPRQDLRTEFRAATEALQEGWKTEDGRWRIEDGGGRTEEGLAGFGLASVRKEDGEVKMEEAEEWMRLGSSARLLEERLAFVGQDIRTGFTRAFEFHETHTLER